MKTSQDRILTTHTGSLPRPPELRTVLVKKDQGEPYDKAELARLTRDAVAAIVRRQSQVGVDVINDGEMSKPGYSTYIVDRLSGFAGHQPAKPRLDTRDHPNFNAAYERMTGANVARRAVCVGPIAVRDKEPLAEDLANLKAALANVSAVEGFMTAASPGLVPVFQTNSYYPTHEAYVEAIAAAMHDEYKAIVDAGFVLQLDCPDLAMAHHTSFQDLSESDFLKRAAFHVEALNHALRDIPAESCRIHICWGNYEGPHDHDIDFAKVAPILVKAKPMALVIEAANPRHAHEWAVWKDVKLPDDKILGGRRPRHLDQLRRAPRPGRRAPLPLRRHRRARAGDGRFGLRLRHLRRLRQARPRHLVQETARDGRGRRDRLEAPVGPRVAGLAEVGATSEGL